MYPSSVRDRARALRAQGRTWSEVSRLLGVNRSTLRSWESAPELSDCPRPAVERALPHDERLAQAYAALLGYYLGDGCISRFRRSTVLRVSCDNLYPGIIDDVEALMLSVHPHRSVFRVPAPGCTVVQQGWRHWPCLFPQHGQGRKHERSIGLEPWQLAVVAEHPGPLLRGLFHSDGCRVRNWARQPVAGELKRYDYPRWQFVNASADIRELCCWALDLVDVAWRQSAPRTISVSRREAVASLDALIGLKR
ncbi:transcriptional regulator [Nocardioides nanhaiensis]|uniref:Transcriptional regulator n=1 Tax=Nocardioides nanhaiensis TaxID=1476871 RepID=A0ABP8WYM1_9ACTN